MPIIDRFWRFVTVPEDPNACWLWQGGRNAAGYPRFRAPTLGEQYAHRVSYRLHHGDIPADYDVMHLCDCPPCVNPLHLRAAPHIVNMQDSVAKGRRKIGSRQPMAKLSEANIPLIRAAWRAGFGPTEIGRWFGVTDTAIRNVMLGRSWQHVPDDD